MSKPGHAAVIAQVILIGSKKDHGLGPGVIGEAEVHAPKSGLPLVAVLAYAEADVIKQFIKIKWINPKKGKPRVPRSTRSSK